MWTKYRAVSRIFLKNSKYIVFEQRLEEVETAFGAC
jgi:hypothetical protein